MRTVVAEDSPELRDLLKTLLLRWGHEVITTANGDQAWNALSEEHEPTLALIDWVMPGVDGLELCRRVRERERAEPAYLVMLTGRERREDLLAGFSAGADDYMIKPFNPEELRARLRVGERVLGLQSQLAARVRELEEATSHIKTLQGVLPICMHCHKIRDDSHSWQRLEEYIKSHSGATFTHGLCEPCLEEHYPQGESA